MADEGPGRMYIDKQGPWRKTLSQSWEAGAFIVLHSVGGDAWLRRQVWDVR